MLYDDGVYYSWSENAAQTSKNLHLLNRRNGLEVLSFINHWVEGHFAGNVYKRTYQQIETKIRYDVPQMMISRRLISIWLKKHLGTLA